MDEHEENDQDLTPAAGATGTPPAAEPAPVPAAVAAGPVAGETRTRWRDRVFRMRSVAAVAAAGVILGATGGAVTTALVSDHDHGDHRRPPGMGRFLSPGGMPAVPPDGRQGFPGLPDGQGDDPEDDQDFPVPPGTDSDSDSGSDSGSESDSSTSDSSYTRS